MIQCAEQSHEHVVISATGNDDDWAQEARAEEEAARAEAAAQHEVLARVRVQGAGVNIPYVHARRIHRHTDTQTHRYACLAAQIYADGKGDSHVGKLLAQF